MTATAAGNANLDGLALGNVGAPANPYLIQSIKVLDLPTKRAVRYQNQSVHGVFLTPLDYFGSRTIAIEIIIANNTATDTMTAVRNLVEKAVIYQEDQRQYLDVWLPGESDVWRYYGRTLDVSTTELNTKNTAVRCNVRFDTDVSAGVSVTETVTTLNYAAPTIGGFSYPRTYNYTYGGAFSSGASITNVGNFPYEPILKIYGPCVDPDIQSDQNSERVKFSGLTIGSGDYVEIDIRNSTVLLNGVSSRYSKLDLAATKFIKIYPGTNNISWRPASGTGSYLEVIWRSARM